MYPDKLFSSDLVWPCHCDMDSGQYMSRIPAQVVHICPVSFKDAACATPLPPKKKLLVEKDLRSPGEEDLPYVQ